MKIQDDEKIARDWIEMIESEKSKVRDGDIYPKLNSWINSKVQKEILDIGCGQGICSEKIDLIGRNYTGIDQSSPLLERAKQLYSSKNRKFIHGNVYQLPFSDSTFDAVFSVAVWHLLPDLNKAAKEMSRVLKPKAHFLIITANPKEDEFWKSLSNETETVYLHTNDEMMNSLQVAQLKVQKTESFRKFSLIEGQKI